MHPEVAKDAPEPLQNLLLMDCFTPESKDRPDIKEVIARLDFILLDQEEQTWLAPVMPLWRADQSPWDGRYLSFPRVTSSILNKGQLPKVVSEGAFPSGLCMRGRHDFDQINTYRLLTAMYHRVQITLGKEDAPCPINI